MHITVEPRDDHAVLHLRGEFDTYYCPHFQAEIDGLLKGGMANAVLNLRLVKFMNSTALGAIIKASKQLGAAGGKLVISRPSTFARDILEKVGLDRVVPVFDSDEEAAAHLAEALPQGRGAEGEEGFAEDESSVLFAPVDVSRVKHFLESATRDKANPVHGHSFGAKWSGVGRMSGLDDQGLRFTWSGGRTGLSPFEMAQMLSIGTDWRVKFRLPLLQRGYCEAKAVVAEVEERPDAVKIGATFATIDATTRDAVRQYAKDLAYLREELKRATE
jgi:anti-anti-sigma factor